MFRHDFHVRLLRLSNTIVLQTGCHALVSLVKPPGSGYDIQVFMMLKSITVAIHRNLMRSLSFQHQLVNTMSSPTTYSPIGGGPSYMFPAADIIPYVVSKKLVYGHDDVFTFVDYVEESAASCFSAKDGFVAAEIPLTNLVPHLSNVMAIKVARHHKIAIGSHVPKKAVPQYFSDHVCNDCPTYHSILRSKKVTTKRNVCKNKINPPQPSQDRDQ